MNEFEWLRQLRALKQPVVPSRDLWARIDTALNEQTNAEASHISKQPIHLSHRHVWVGAASIIAIIVLASGLAWRMHWLSKSTATFSQNTIHSHTWKPSDPRFTGAAVELQAAQMQLQQAMQQAPQSPVLQRLLQRTDAQQASLREFEKQAS